MAPASDPLTVYADVDLELSDRDLRTITQLVYEKSGITLGDAKRPLIVARLQKRLRNGRFGSFGEYLQHVASDRSGGELTALLDAITTNHTSFFREAQHFDFLTERIVPEWLERRDGAPLTGWSAPCSTGEEPYSIAMTLLECIPASEHGRVLIDACDLSTKAVRTARAGVYPLARVEGVPLPTLRKYFERGMGDQSGLARVRRSVRERVDISEQNLLEIQSTGRTYSFIFCRNVMIYFDRPVQQRVVAMLERHLVDGGYLFIAHSESLNGVQHGLEWVAPAIYRKGRA
jgi:chemotaxis protein methyltransferase CheR